MNSIRTTTAASCYAHLFCLCTALTMLPACGSAQSPKSERVSGQTYAQAIRQMCDVDRLASIDPSGGELEISRQRQDYMAGTIKHPDAIYFVTIWRTKPPEVQAALLAEEAKGAGISSCKLEESLRNYQ